MRWKKVLVAAAVVVVVLIVAGISFISLYDFNKFKPMVAQAVKEATGRELTIGGDIDIDLGFSPTLVVQDISFQNATWGSRAQLAKVKKIDVKVALLPLLRDRYEFVELILLEPDVLVEINKMGRSNLDFEAPTQESEEKDKESDALPVLVFDNVVIDKGRVTYIDGRSGDSHTLMVERLDAEIPGLDKSMALNLTATWDDIPFQIEGNLGPIGAWIETGTSWSADLTARTGGATINIKGDIRDPDNFKDLAFTLTGEGPSTLEIAKLAGMTELPDLGAYTLSAKVGDPEGKLSIQEFNVHVGSEEFAEISIDGVVKDVLSAQGFNIKFSIRGRDSDNLSQFGLPPLPAKGPFRATGNIFDSEARLFSMRDFKVVLANYEMDGRLDLNLTTETPQLTARLTSPDFILGPLNLAAVLSGPMDKLALENLDLQLGSAKLAQIILKGAIKDLLGLQNGNIDFVARSENLANLKKIAGRTIPVRGAFHASGRIITPNRNKLGIPEIKIAFGKTNIAGKLDLNLEGQKPLLSANLSSPKLDLRSILIPKLAKQDWVKTVSDFGPLRLAAKLAGSVQEGALKELDLQAGTEKLAKLRIRGGIQNLSTWSGIDLNFAIQGKNTANLKKFIKKTLPVHGAFAVSGQIRDPKIKTYQVRNLRVVLAENSLKGRVDLNLAGKQPQLKAELSTPKFNLRPLRISDRSALAGLKRAADLGPLKIKAQLAGPADKPALNQLDFEAGSEKLIHVQLNGAVKDLSAPSGMNLNLAVRGKDVSRLAKITGRSLPLRGAYAVSGRISDPTANTYSVRDLKVNLGPNRIVGRLDLNLAAKRMQLVTDLSAQQFNLQPLSIPAIQPLNRISNLGPLKLSIKLAGPSDTLAIENLDLSLGTEEQLAVTLKGKLQPSKKRQVFALEFGVRGKEMANLKKAGLPELPFQGAYYLSGRLVKPAPKIYRFPSLKFVMGENTGNGSLKLNLTRKRPQVKADLAFPKLDLRPFFTETAQKDAAGKKPATPAKPRDKVFSKAPWSLDKLKIVNAEIKIRDSQVLLPDLAFNSLKADILLKNGNLVIKPFTFKSGGGLADGGFNLRFQNKIPTLAVGLKIDHLDIGPMLDQLGYQRTLEGTLDSTINLTGRGNSLAQWMAGLDGEIVLKTGNGKFSNEYVSLLEKTFGGGVVRLFNPFRKKRSVASVNCFINNIQITDGLAKCRLLLDTDETAILTAGHVDLKTEKLDFGIKPTPKKGHDVSGVGKVSLSLKELSHPFRLGGTLAQPSLEIDPSRVARTIGKFAGLVAVGPVGMAAFFSDISVGKRDPCLEFIKAIEKEAQGSTSERPSGEKKKATTKEKKSGGLLKKLFRQ
jgi:uncharacterized protein involved in outer membrane biogenesis